MRRTDLSRKIGKAISAISEVVEETGTIDIKMATQLIKNEVDLRADKLVEAGAVTIVNFKDDDFEGTIKRTDIYNVNPISKENGVNDIKTNHGMVQLKYLNDGSLIEVGLVVEVEYLDNSYNKHTTYVILNNKKIYMSYDVVKAKDSEEMIARVDYLEENTVLDDNNEIMGDNINEIAVDDDIIVNEDVQTVIDDIVETQETTHDYKYYIGVVVSGIFANKFYNSKASDELIDIVTNKIHSIYVVGYLEELYTKDNILDDTTEGVNIVNKILDSLL
ncbi:MAG: hypothetical protein ACRCX8_02930 [Sarcina sp.]